MRFEASQQLRLGQHMKLAPRMIQSMEILQLASMALEERIEQELESNIALETDDPVGDDRTIAEERAETEREDREGERELIPDSETGDGSADFERLNSLVDSYREAFEGEENREMYTSRPTRRSDDVDAKMEAMANTAARGESLADQLYRQWDLAEVDEATDGAGRHLIGYIDDDGYVRTDMDTIALQAGPGVKREDLERTLPIIQQWLEPPGLGARDLRECLLLQLDALDREDADRAVSLSALAASAPATLPEAPAAQNPSAPTPSATPTTSAAAGGVAPSTTANAGSATSLRELERLIVRDHLDDLAVNRVPRIAEQTSRSIEEIKAAVDRLSALDPRPGSRLVPDSPTPVVPDAMVEYDETTDSYVAALCDGRLPRLRINPEYALLARNRAVDRTTREFVDTNVRQARWLIEAIQQRNSTLLRVINVVLAHQRDFFDQGPQALRPLPMTQVAEQLGIHVATVSRAVSGKWLQTPRGILPLRKFFTAGTENEAGESVSWDAVRETLREIIAAEDKREPLGDDKLAAELKARGVPIARRTVAKYRDQLGIASARLRKVY